MTDFQDDDNPIEAVWQRGRLDEYNPSTRRLRHAWSFQLRYAWIATRLEQMTSGGCRWPIRRIVKGGRQTTALYKALEREFTESESESESESLPCCEDGPGLGWHHNGHPCNMAGQPGVHADFRRGWRVRRAHSPSA